MADLRSLSLENEEKEEVAMEEASPRGVLEDCMRSSDSETSSSRASTSSYAEAQMAHGHHASLWRGFLRLWRQKPMRRLASFPPFGIPGLSRRRRSQESDGSRPAEVEGLCHVKPSWKIFSLSELKRATNNFSQENIIGKGGYAKVYKGSLDDGQLVAVKKLTKGFDDERINNFLSEIGIAIHVDHPNIAKLVGVGSGGGEHLVFRLSPLGSLSTMLHGSTGKFDWDDRYKIAIGTAKGLEYLHEKCQRRIIHRDIKAANILLAEDFQPQICDFGLAKWLPDKWTHHQVSSFEGTFGYLAPEYCTHGIINEKTDVFAFGVLLLELLSGRKALDPSRQSLLIWAKPLLETNQIRDLIDPSLGNPYDLNQVKNVAHAAHACIQQSPALRPRMSQVLQLLKGEEDQSEPANVIKKSLIRRTYSEEIFDAEEYNATKYLKDLNRHRKLALEF